MPDYFFRDDLEADKQREADAAAAGPTTLAAPPPPVAPVAPAPAQDKTFQNLGKAAAAPDPNAKPDYFADFRSAMDAQDPFKQQAQAAVTESLKNPTAGFDAAAKAQEDKLGRETAAEQERRRQQAVLSFGGNQTGQVSRAMDTFGNEALMKQAELGRDLAAGRAQAGEVGRGNAINQATALLGEGRQAAATAADIGIRQTGQNIELSIAEKQLKENARQFDTRQAFEEYATKEGWNQDAIARAWESLENDKKLTSTEKVAYAQIGSSERMQQSAQNHDTAMRDLDRTLEKMLSTDRIQAQFQILDITNTFNEKMQSAGFVQDKELEAMRADLQTRLQERGIAADVAKQIADQKYDEMKTSKEQAFDEKMTDINQRFLTGERVETQEWESSMKSLDQRHEELLQQRELAAQQGLQTERLDVEIAENEKQRASQEMMATAQLASSDKNFMAELQQKYDFNDQDMDLRRTELEGQMKLMGLQGEQLTQAMGDSKIKTAMDMAALGMEIGNGSPESMAPFVEALGSAMSGYMKGQGINIAAGDISKALSGGSEPLAPGATPTSKQSAEDFKTFVNNTSSFPTLEAQQKFTTDMIKFRTLGVNLPVDKVGGVPDSKENAILILEASNRLKALGVTGATLSTNFAKKRVGDTSTHDVYSASQPGLDYAIYARMVKSGLSEAEAQTALAKLIPPDRAKAALALESGSSGSNMVAGANVGAQAGGM